MKKDNEITMRSSAAEYLTYVASTGSNGESIEMRYEDETVGLHKKMMATLYGVETNTINYHIKKYLKTANWTKIQLFEKFE